ncbi:hypothetical protein [Pelagerythrobacter marensis]|uniref:Bacterial dipeptidyl-peptidase SH3 domain-containing protein n=1 Tax=Pelagerythrobacter marensis TaxID=543877 RepID=A0A0G3X7A1_9SPHN|nr:hypothetical protein [Pelagerythrobacter marensis]AKM06499.1 hypothetical protein AM2010_412 [Pelagerythrobacter marensis]
MTSHDQYQLPEGPIGLKGPVARPAPGTLPLRGDLAHIALAGRYLAAHYVVPQSRTIGTQGAALHLAPGEDSPALAQLEAGTDVEALDYAGDWCWASCGPEGPSGYLRIERLTQ